MEADKNLYLTLARVFAGLFSGLLSGLLSGFLSVCFLHYKCGRKKVCIIYYTTRNLLFVLFFCSSNRQNQPRVPRSNGTNYITNNIKHNDTKIN